MTPEQRLDRVERILTLFVRAGRRTRSEWRLRTREHDARTREHDVRTREHDDRLREQDERISIIVKTQQETEEIMKGLALGQARVNYEMAELAKSQRLTDRALRAFINRSRKRKTGSRRNS